MEEDPESSDLHAAESEQVRGRWLCVCVCARATTVTTSDRVSYREDKSRMSEGMERRKRMNNLETAACQRV